MSANLDSFIDEVVATLQAIAGLNMVGEAPTELAKWPAAPVYSISGSVDANIGEVANWLHDVRVGLLGPLDADTDKVAAVLVPLLEPMIEALFKKMLAQQFTSIDNFGRIDYIFGPIEWGAEEHFGFLLTIYDVKIRRIIT